MPQVRAKMLRACARTVGSHRRVETSTQGESRIECTKKKVRCTESSSMEYTYSRADCGAIADISSGRVRGRTKDE